MKQKRSRKFLYRMVLSYTLAFSLLLAAILTIVFFILAASQQSQSELNHRLLVNQPLGQLDQFIEEMDDTAYKAMGDYRLINTFTQLRDEASPQNHFTTHIMDDIETASVLGRLNHSIKPAWRVSAYNNYGDFNSTGTIVDKNMVQDALAQRQPEELMQTFSDWFSAEGRIGYILLGPETDHWSDYYKSNYVTLLRPIMNIYSGDVVGIVEVQQNISMLSAYLAPAQGSTLKTNVYDENGAPVLIQGGENDVVVATATSEISSWRVELLEDAGVLRATGVNTALILVAAWVVLTAIIALVIGLIARRISGPLTTLTNSVRHINVANPQQLPPVATKIDEILALHSGFNQVLDELTFSMEQEKKSFLLAMQAQMNPHFLYNVLSVVNAVALEGRSDDIVKICANLSGMLRYSSSYARGTATVSEELEHTREYLELMKARYDYMFHYTITVDPALRGKTIPKLVIQPICENAFTHPFANMEPPYRLDIRVETIPGGWCIRVADNGPGFSDAARRQVMDRANKGGYEDLNKMQIGGLGLVSAVIRLKLITRQQVVCDIQTANPTGAVVVLNIFES